MIIYNSQLISGLCASVLGNFQCRCALIRRPNKYTCVSGFSLKKLVMIYVGVNILFKSNSFIYHMTSLLFSA